MSGGTAFDITKYGALLAASLPQAITTDEENNARIEELEAYSFAGDLTPEQEAYSKLLAILIETYEQCYRVSRTLDAVDAIKLLMSNRELQQADLVPVIGNKSHVAGSLLPLPKST